MIELKGLERFYETAAGRFYVLRRVGLDIKEGEFVTVMGPSGAGKSTLLSILGMLDTSWSGEYWLYGEPIHKLKPRERIERNKRYFGFVFQSYHLLDDQTVYENLELPLSYRNMRSADRASIVCDVLDRFQIVGKKDFTPASSPAASSSWSQSRGRWWRVPRSSWPTNPPATSIRRRRRRSWNCSSS